MNLVEVKSHDCFTNSLAIAEGTKNKHITIRKLIDIYKKSLERFGRLSFEMTPLETKGGVQEVKVYSLNEPQATFLITLLRNNDVVIEFKISLVQEFYRMRQILMQQATPQWQMTRLQGKAVRREETDVIKLLVEYAKNQGSKNAQMLYMTYSKLANSLVGVKSRDEAGIIELNRLSMIEHIILNVILKGMECGKHYKEIYQDSKAALNNFMVSAYLA